MRLNIDAARRWLASELAKNNIAGHELESRLLVQHVTGLTLTELAIRGSDPLSASAADQLTRLASRRLAGEPVARILGEQEFWGLRFALSPATLIPRSDTETLVEAVLESIDNKTAPLRIADLGTGTGAILVSLLTELPNASGVGTDTSEQALQTATANAARHGMADRANFIVSDYASRLDGAFDIIVSNPPYIQTNDIGHLTIEVRDHDPHLALDGGPDGLDAYRKITSQVPQLLANNGLLGLEIGAGQDPDVARIIAEAGLVATGPAKPDLAGIARVILARKPRP